MALQEKQENRIALLWGFTEALIFFLIPEVWTSTIAVRRGTMAGLKAGAFAISGTMVGVTLLFLWGQVSPDSAKTVIGMIPYVGDYVLEDAFEYMRKDGEFGLVFGVFNAVPFKAMAAQASGRGINIFLFLFITVFALSVRMIAVTSLFGGIAALLKDKLDLAKRTKVAIGVWVALYGISAALWFVNYGFSG